MSPSITWCRVGYQDWKLTKSSHKGRHPLIHGIVFQPQCCIVFSLPISCLEYKYTQKLCIKTQTRFSSTAAKTTGLTLSLRVNVRWRIFFHHVALGVNLRLLFFFQSGSCLRILPTPPTPPPPFRSVVSHMNSTCRLVENLN